MTEKVTNEVIIERIEGIKDLFSSKLEAIHEQTKKTNGRVTTLEDRQSKCENRLSKYSGGLVVVDIVLFLAVSVIALFIK